MQMHGASIHHQQIQLNLLYLFGNKYHTICDGELDWTTGTPIMWHVEIQEGKDRPVQLGPKKFNNAGGETVGLMLRIHKPIAHCGKACTMDSGLCVSKGIVEMQEKLGVYGQGLIKKRGVNWPKGVPGDEIDRHFADKPLGYCETLRLEIDGKQMFIHCMKEGGRSQSEEACTNRYCGYLEDSVVAPSSVCFLLGDFGGERCEFEGPSEGRGCGTAAEISEGIVPSHAGEHP